MVSSRSHERRFEIVYNPRRFHSKWSIQWGLEAMLLLDYWKRRFATPGGDVAPKISWKIICKTAPELDELEIQIVELTGWNRARSSLFCSRVKFWSQTVILLIPRSKHRHKYSQQCTVDLLAIRGLINEPSPPRQTCTLQQGLLYQFVINFLRSPNSGFGESTTDQDRFRCNIIGCDQWERKLCATAWSVLISLVSPNPKFEMWIKVNG